MFYTAVCTTLPSPHAHTHTHTHVHAYTYIHTRMHTFTHTYTTMRNQVAQCHLTFISYTHTYIHTYIHAYTRIHIHNSAKPSCSLPSAPPYLHLTPPLTHSLSLPLLRSLPLPRTHTPPPTYTHSRNMTLVLLPRRLGVCVYVLVGVNVCV